MASNIKNVKLIRSEAYGYGFSILGGAGSELPPIVYDIIDGSPASKASELSQGDIIWEINGKEVLSCTTKEVLNYLRLSPKEVQLKLKTDSGIQEKIKNLKKDPYNPETLRTAITKQDLIGVREIVAKKSEPHEAKLPTSATSCHTVTYERRVEVNGKTDESYKSISKNEDFEKNFYGKDVHNPEKKPKSNIHLGTEKSDDNSCSAVAKPVTHRAPCASSPPMSEDESDIESLHSFHFSPKAVDVPSVIRLAKRLFMLDGFKKSDVSRHLSKNNEFSKAVAEEYLHYFDFRGDTLDIALRKFLDRFCLAGETQDRERVLVHFSRWYLDCNPGTFNSQDAVHTLTCALMLLNTDLHNENIGRKMTCVEFIDNLAELNDGENFSSDVLKFLYESIKKLPLKWAADDDQVDGTVRVKNGRRQIDEGSLIIGSNPFLTAPMGSGVIYKKGYIMRKCCIEPNGKKTAFGKRSWKMWFCVIQDLALYLHKDEQGARKGPPPQLGQNAVRLHHALAVKAHDYLKKEHVFRLQTADQAEYLLQTSDRKELQAWIDAINFVASSLSAPPMPGAVGSQHKFQRPLLPCSITKLNIVEQLEDHTRRLAQLEKELDSHRNNPPDKNAKSATVSNYKEKETYLVYELKRYQTYVSLLRSRLNPTRSGLNLGTPAMPNLDMNDLPVFDVKNSPTEQAEGAKEDEHCVVPPPIPERPRPGDSFNVDETAQDPFENNKETQTQRRSKEDKRKDEFRKDLEKMLKEKEKREKNAQKREEKEKNAQKREEKEKNAQKREEKEKKASVSRKMKEDKESATDMVTKKRCEDEGDDDPGIGTMDRLRALFKFNKLNRAFDERRKKTEKETVQEENGCKEKTELLKEPEDEHLKNATKTDDMNFGPPPPLPPKPLPGSPITMITGTRLNI